MGVGKYSPTVVAAYAADQDWHKKLCPEDDWYDDEGYDSYGYHKDTEKDRADGTWWDYVTDNNMYEKAMHAWGFNGVRPYPK